MFGSGPFTYAIVFCNASLSSMLPWKHLENINRFCLKPYNGTLHHGLLSPRATVYKHSCGFQFGSSDELFRSQTVRILLWIVVFVVVVWIVCCSGPTGTRVNSYASTYLLKSP